MPRQYADQSSLPWRNTIWSIISGDTKRHANSWEEYKALLTRLIEDSDPNDADDKHLLVVANLQRNTTNGLINTLDTDIHDDLTRLSDRVIRFRHWEGGLFV